MTKPESVQFLIAFGLGLTGGFLISKAFDFGGWHHVTLFTLGALFIALATAVAFHDKKPKP